MDPSIAKKTYGTKTSHAHSLYNRLELYKNRTITKQIVDYWIMTIVIVMTIHKYKLYNYTNNRDYN